MATYAQSMALSIPPQSKKRLVASAWEEFRDVWTRHDLHLPCRESFLFFSIPYLTWCEVDVRLRLQVNGGLIRSDRGEFRLSRLHEYWCESLHNAESIEMSEEAWPSKNWNTCVFDRWSRWWASRTKTQHFHPSYLEVWCNTSDEVPRKRRLPYRGKGCRNT